MISSTYVNLRKKLFGPFETVKSGVKNHSHRYRVSTLKPISRKSFFYFLFFGTIFAVRGNLIYLNRKIDVSRYHIRTYDDERPPAILSCGDLSPPFGGVIYFFLFLKEFQKILNSVKRINQRLAIFFRNIFF